MNIQTKYDIGDTVWLLTNDMPRQGVVEAVYTSATKDDLLHVEYNVNMVDSHSGIWSQDRLRADERSVLLDMAEQLEAKAKVYRDKAEIVEQPKTIPPPPPPPNRVIREGHQPPLPPSYGKERADE